MKAKTVFFSLIIWGSTVSLLQGQIRSDFILAEDGTQPRIALDRLGNIHAIWLDRNADGKVAYGLFDSLGNQKRAPQNFGGAFFTFNPKMAVNGEYGVMLYDAGHPSAEIGLGGTQFTLDGEPMPGLLDILDDLGYDGFDPDVTFVTDTTFFVVWAGEAIKQGAEGNDIFGHMLTTSLRLLGTKQILIDENSEDLKRSLPRIATHSNSDKLVAVWREEFSSTHDQIFGRILSKDGIPQGPTFQISDIPDTLKAFFPTPAMTKDGDFIVAWSAGKPIQGADWGIYLRRFDADGMPIEESQKINVDPAIGSAEVDISVDLNDRYIVVWEGRESAKSNIFAQRFAADGALIGNNFKIATRTDTLTQIWPDAVLRNGKIYTGWSTREGSSFKIWLNILDFDNPIVSVEKQSGSYLEGFQLFQNYPNPFNPATTISYEITCRANVRLVIFNLLGEEVITLIDEQVMPGIHQEVWDGKNGKGIEMPSGIYLYQLRVNDAIQTKKMVFVR